MRYGVELVVTALIGLLLLVTWQVQWFQVQSGSMAPALVGLHRDVRCADCGLFYQCGTDGPPLVGQRAVCPGCGYAQQRLDAQGDAAGDRLLVDKSAFAVRRPRRWEPVVFRWPGAATMVQVKRVVGLPGEQIELRDGNVYVDGQIARKTLTQQRAIAVLVHDSQAVPQLSTTLPRRWRNDDAATRWRSDSAGFFHPGGSTTGTAVRELPATDWLTYHHQRHLPGNPWQVEEATISDHYGYNQVRPVVESHDATDLLLSCRLRTRGSGRWALFISDGRRQFVARINPAANRAWLFSGGQQVSQASLVESGGGTSAVPAEMQVELSLVDLQFILALDGRLILQHAYEPTDLPVAPSSRPLAIGSQGLGLHVEALRVWRDVVYTRWPGRQANRPAAATYQLGGDEYFVLGDNSPLSADSRSWPDTPGVPANLLVGKPFLVYLPFRRVDHDGLGFQVPDLPRIRYIR